MGQVLIRNLDEAMVEDYRAEARANGRSLEAELREALKRNRPDLITKRRELAMQVRSMLPDPTPGPEGTEIIGWYRDTNGGRDPDVF